MENKIKYEKPVMIVMIITTEDIMLFSNDPFYGEDDGLR